MDNKATILESYQNITKSNDVSFLDQTDWDLDRAINLYYAVVTHDDGEKRGSKSKRRSSSDEERSPKKFSPDTDSQNDYMFRERKLPKCDLLGQFSLPPSLLFHGSFDKALTTGIFLKKLIILNIMDPMNFDSVVLNRDLWSNSMLQEVIGANFILWQLIIPDKQIEYFRLFYTIKSFPFIGVFCPITTRLLFTFNVNTSAEDMIDRLITLYDSSHFRDDDNKKDESHIDDLDSPTIDYNMDEEPPASDLSTSIRLVLFNGSVYERRFLKTNRINDLFFWVKCLEVEARLKPFDLIIRLPKTCLSLFMDRTIQDMDLNRTTIAAVWN